jgi:hypothetical protein
VLLLLGFKMPYHLLTFREKCPLFSLNSCLFVGAVVTKVLPANVQMQPNVFFFVGTNDFPVVVLQMSQYACSVT